MRPIVKFAGAGALACASLLAFAVSADAKMPPPGAGHAHANAPHGAAAPHGDYRHEGADRSFERRYRRNLAGYLAGGALGAETTYPGYGEGETPVGAGYAAPPPVEAPPAYANDGVERVVFYQNVTRNYTVPVRSYRTVQKTHYVPVVSYRAVTSEYQVPVTTYETVQRTEQTPVVYRVVHHACGCSLGY
jgi:hypothetical protein